MEEVETSGQMVEAFDAANYLMTSSGLYLLVGALLAALGGFYLTRPTGSLDKGSSADYQDNPAVPTTSKTTRPLPWIRMDEIIDIVSKSPLR